MDISHLRREYREKPLHKADLLNNPVDQFRKWLEEAIQVEEIEPNAMSLATVGEGGRPSCRTVLLKQFDDAGFVFFTNLNSRKAKQIQRNPWGAATFWWRHLERQVCMEGSIENVPRELTALYFAKRPRNSQLSAWASEQQSAPLTSREELENNFKLMDAKMKGEVPLPPFWGGFRLIPERFEFWQGRSSRLHDRFVYKKENGQWIMQALFP